MPASLTRLTLARHASSSSPPTPSYPIHRLSPSSPRRRTSNLLPMPVGSPTIAGRRHKSVPPRAVRPNVTHRGCRLDPYSDPRVFVGLPYCFSDCLTIFVRFLILTFVLDLLLALEPFPFPLSQRTSNVAERPYTHTHTPYSPAHNLPVYKPFAWLQPGGSSNDSSLVPRFVRVPTASSLTPVTTLNSLHRAFSSSSGRESGTRLGLILPFLIEPTRRLSVYATPWNLELEIPFVRQCGGPQSPKLGMSHETKMRPY